MRRAAIYTTEFWVATSERVVSTAAQSAIAAIGTTALVGDLDWRIVSGTVVTASILSVLKAVVAASPVVPGDGPSLVQAEQTSPPGPSAGGEQE